MTTDTHLQLRRRIGAGVRVALLCLGVHGHAGAEERTLTFRPGQVLSFVTSEQRPGTDEARDAYFSRVLPLAASHGFRSEGGFSIREVIPETYSPTPYMNLFSWPDRDARRRFVAEPTWLALESDRPRIWSELRICSVSLPHPVTLRFRSDRDYSISFAWLAPDHPGDFDRYLAGMKPTLRRLGVAKLLEAAGLELTSLVETTDPPDRVWISEWPGPEARAAYLESPAFRDHLHLFRSGVRRFERYGVSFDFSNDPGE